MFASQKHDTLRNIPGVAETETIEIRKLGWRALEAAAKERQRQGLETLRTIGPGGLIAELQAQGGEDEVRKKADADPFLAYDAMTLLEKGIVAWSLSKNPTTAEIEDLDAETATHVARAIFELSRPKSEAERKNG